MALLSKMSGHFYFGLAIRQAALRIRSHIRHYSQTSGVAALRICERLAVFFEQEIKSSMRACHNNNNNNNNNNTLFIH